MAGNEIWRPAGEPSSKEASIFPRSAERGKSAREYLKRQTIRFTPAVRYHLNAIVAEKRQRQRRREREGARRGFAGASRDFRVPRARPQSVEGLRPSHLPFLIRCPDAAGNLPTPAPHPCPDIRVN